jgi:putative two-component system response regulator
VLTADLTPQAKQKALSEGARDFLTKPLDFTETLLRIYNLLEIRCLHVDLERHNERLEERVRERTQELEQAQAEILHRLALASELRDDDTGQHTQRVGQLAALLARALGLPDDQIELIRQAAPLHDVGKIGIPDSILLKPATLTAEEMERVKQHTELGRRLLWGSKSPVLQMAEQIALFHHERWDGNGYHGLKGEAIPLEARIVSVADTFDVITHTRPYKPPKSVAFAIDTILREKGRQFDPRVVDAFLGLHQSDDLTRLAEALEQKAPPASVLFGK